MHGPTNPAPLLPAMPTPPRCMPRRQPRAFCVQSLEQPGLGCQHRHRSPLHGAGSRRGKGLYFHPQLLPHSGGRIAGRSRDRQRGSRQRHPREGFRVRRAPGEPACLLGCCNSPGALHSRTGEGCLTVCPAGLPAGFIILTSPSPWPPWTAAPEPAPRAGGERHGPQPCACTCPAGTA